MNFIYSLFFWILTFVGVTAIRHFSVNPSSQDALLVLQWINGLVFLGFLITCIFYQMSKKQELLRIKNAIKRLNKQKTIKTKRYNELKGLYEKYLAEQYPNIEKEIFSKLAEKPEDLTILLQTFPELKSSNTLSDLIDKSTSLIKSIYDQESRIEYKTEEFNNIKDDSWFFKSKIELE